jgi:uncharacterized protein (DUF2267 family)
MVGAKCWESNPEELDPKHEREKHEGMERVPKQKERRRKHEVLEHVNSVINARSTPPTPPPRGDPKGAYL